MVKSVLWEQGMPLLPHHFQQQDLFTQSLTTPFYHYGFPYFYGAAFIKLQNNAEELDWKQREFTFEKLKIVFQDISDPKGIFLEYYKNDIESGNALVQPVKINDGKTTVYAVLKKINYNSNIVSKIQELDIDFSSIQTRFVSFSNECLDLYKGEGNKEYIEKMYYIVKLVREDELENNYSDYIKLKIATFEVRGAHVKLSNNFVPPSISISGSDILKSVVHDFHIMIETHVDKIMDFLQYFEENPNEDILRFLNFKSMVRILNRYNQCLLHQINSQVHPFEIYGNFRMLIGELMPFVEDNFLQTIPDYDHENIFSCFSEAKKILQSIFKDIRLAAIINFEKDFDKRYFYINEIDKNRLEKGENFYLILETDKDIDSKISADSIHQNIKIFHKGDYESYALRQLGEIRFSEKIPKRNPTSPRCKIRLRIDHKDNPYWNAQIKTNMNIAVGWANAPDDLQLKLFIIGNF